MDRNFMSDYYEMRYDSLMRGAEMLDNPEYQAAGKALAKAEEELSKLIGGVGTDGWETYERCVNAHVEMEGYFYKQMYLEGAKDREKMLR